MTPEEETALKALRAKPSAELTREDCAAAVAALRGPRRLAHDISAAAAAKRVGKGKRKTSTTEG